MQEKQLDKESMKGTIYVLLSAVCFSTGGVLIKSIPWSSITIQGNPQYFFIYADRIIYGHHKTKVCMEQNGVVWSRLQYGYGFNVCFSNKDDNGGKCDRASVYRTNLCDSADVGII